MEYIASGVQADVYRTYMFYKLYQAEFAEIYLDTY